MIDYPGPPSAEQYEAAVLAGCEALVALQVIHTSCADDSALKRLTARTIGSLRSTIIELRDAGAQRGPTLANGFVLEAAPPHAPGLL